MSIDLFISYRRTDQTLVEALVPKLEARGLSVWWDANIEGGDDWRDAIVEHLTESGMLLVLFSEACNSSRQLRKELAIADHLGKPVIPVLIEDTEPKGYYLYELAARNWIQLFPDPLSKLDRLAEAVSAKVQGDREERGSLMPPVPDSSAAKDTPGPTGAQPPPTPPLQQQQTAPRPSRKAATERARDFLPFRWPDFVLPIVIGVTVAITEALQPTTNVETGGPVALGLGFGLVVLALVGMVVFPVRYYRRQRSPRRVAGMLLLSNLVLGVVLSFAMERSLPSSDEAVEEPVIAILVTAGIMMGLTVSLVSFVIFATLSALRAHRKFRANLSRI